MVERKTAEMNALFSRYVNCENIVINNVEPFDYDFSQIREYDYKMDFIQIGKNIEFFQRQILRSCSQDRFYLLRGAIASDFIPDCVV